VPVKSAIDHQSGDNGISTSLGQFFAGNGISECARHVRRVHSARHQTAASATNPSGAVYDIIMKARLDKDDARAGLSLVLLFGTLRLRFVRPRAQYGRSPLKSRMSLSFIRTYRRPTGFWIC
jgi:hypothetical protein